MSLEHCFTTQLETLTKLDFMEITLEMAKGFEVIKTKLNLQEKFLWLNFNQVVLFYFIKLLRNRKVIKICPLYVLFPEIMSY